jgi:predicted nucleic acid-binding protein
MSSRRLVDTNVIVRHLTQDHPKHAAMAGKLFSACDRGEVTLIILPAVLAECVFVLESFHNRSHSDIGQVLARLISSPGVEIDSRPVHLDALERYAKSKLHFVDCTIAAAAAASGTSVATFDAGMRKFSDVQVELD